MQKIIIIPTYNEAENLEQLVTALRSLAIPDLGILVVDDDSPDGTGRIADELARTSDGVLRVLHRRQRKRGYGPSLVDGIREALSLGAEYIAHMDADFSHQPRYLPALLAAAEDADLVIGSRYVPGGSVAENWHFLRLALSKFANQFYVRLFLRLPIQDATGGFRIYRRAVIEAIDLQSIRSNGYSFQLETAYRCYRRGFRLYEVPIHFPDRARGKSKMNWRIALEAALRVLLLRWQSRNL